MSRLAIIDWGIGGLGIYTLVKKRLDLPIIYFSDTGVTPYGKMTGPQLVARLNTVISNLKSRGITHLVVGCNAASTEIKNLSDHGIRIEGMIESAVAETVGRVPTRLGLIGGRRTILSGVYRKSFAQYGIRVEQRIAQPLSQLIEDGDTSSDALKDEAKRILRPLRNCSHILLACTHYPAIATLLTGFVSPITEFIDPAGSLLQRIADWKLTRSGEDEFHTSGDPAALKFAASTALSVEIDFVSKAIF